MHFASFIARSFVAFFLLLLVSPIAHVVCADFDGQVFINDANASCSGASCGVMAHTAVSAPATLPLSVDQVSSCRPAARLGLSAFALLALQLCFACREAAAAAALCDPRSCLSQPLRLLALVEYGFKYLWSRLSHAYGCFVFCSLVVSVTAQRCFSRVFRTIVVVAAILLKAALCLGPFALCFVLVHQVTASPQGVAPSRVPGPPVAHGGYGVNDLFVFQVKNTTVVGPTRSPPESQIRLPSSLSHAQGEFDSIVRRSERHVGLNDTGASFDCHVSPRAYPVVDGVPSLQAPPSNVEITAAEGTVQPPEGYGCAQTVWTDNLGDDYIYYGPQSWYVPAFDKTLFSESAMAFHARAVSFFYFGRKIVFPNAEVPMKMRNRVYEVEFKYLDQTDYLPVPNGAAVAGLWLARCNSSPLPPSTKSPAGVVASASAVTRSRGTPKHLQSDYKTNHSRTHASPRVLARWCKVADSVGKLPESLAEVCDACLFADGTSFAGAPCAPEPAHEGAWALDTLGPLPESLFGKYRYAHIAANRTNRRYFVCPTRTRDELQHVRERLVAHCKKFGLEFHELTTDGAGEMVSGEATAYLLGQSAGLNIGCAHEHNNKQVERAIGRLSRMARAFSCHGLNDADAAVLWPESLACAVEVHNVLPCKIGGLWTSPTLAAGLPRPDVGHLRSPFCDARILLQGPATQAKILPKRVHAMYAGPDVLGEHRGWSFITGTRTIKAYGHEGIFKESCFSGLAGVRSGVQRRPTALDSTEDDSSVLLGRRRWRA